MAYDETRRQIVLFGGLSLPAGTNPNDTWVWDGTNWSELSPATSPSARAYTGMVYDAARGGLVLFGGENTSGGHLNDTWVWDGTTWTQRAVSGPSPRAPSTMACDVARGVTVLFGGYDGGINGETWEWDGTAWTVWATGTG